MKSLDSLNRVDSQMRLSDKVYQSLDRTLSSTEKHHRLILRDCLGTLAVSLNQSHGYGHAGDMAYRRLIGHLADDGLTIEDPAYAQYPEYRNYVATIQSNKFRLLSAPNETLAEVFRDYGDATRITRDTLDEPETNSRHAVHVTTLAVPYACQEYPDLDSSLVALYGLIHDILEWRIGDTPSLNISPEAYQQKNENEALELEYLERLIGVDYPKLITLIKRYEALSDDEAKFIKTFDKLDPGFTHFANQGAVIRERGIDTPQAFWNAHHATYVRMSQYALDYPKIIEDRDTRAKMICEVTWPTPNGTS